MTSTDVLLTSTKGGCIYYVQLIDDRPRCTWVNLRKSKIFMPLASLLQPWLKHYALLKSKFFWYWLEMLSISLEIEWTQASSHSWQLLMLCTSTFFCISFLFWEAIPIVVYLTNCTPSSVLSNVTPFENLFKSNPNYIHLLCLWFNLLHPLASPTNVNYCHFNRIYVHSLDMVLKPKKKKRQKKKKKKEDNKIMIPRKIVFIHQYIPLSRTYPIFHSTFIILFLWPKANGLNISHFSLLALIKQVCHSWTMCTSYMHNVKW